MANFKISPRNLHALKLCLGALTAFIIAHTLGLQHAYWASMPIWVIPGVSREEFILKGIYRVLGTILGGILALTIVSFSLPIFIKVLFLAFLIALFTATARTQKALYGYSNLLTAVTLTIISLPGLYREDAREIMLSRLSCTLIGVITAILFLAFDTKRSYDTHKHIPHFQLSRLLIKIKLPEFQKTFCLVLFLSLLSFAGLLWGARHNHLIDSELFAFGIIIFSIVLGVHEKPKKQSRYILTGAVIGSVVAIMYRQYLHLHLPHDFFLLLYLSLIPFFLIGAYFKTSSLATKGAADACLCFLLIARPGDLISDFSSYLAQLKFLLIGAIFVTLVFQWPYFENNLKREEVRCL